MEIAFASALGEKSVFEVSEPDADGFQRVHYGDVELGVIRLEPRELLVFIDPVPLPIRVAVPLEVEGVDTVASALEYELPSEPVSPAWEHAPLRPLLLQQVCAFLTPRKVEEAPPPPHESKLSPLERIAELEARLAKLGG